MILHVISFPNLILSVRLYDFFSLGFQENLRLIEVHLDIGGDLMIEAFYPKAFNFDFLKFAVEMAVGINKTPIDLRVKPTAIYYNEGDGLISDRGYKVLQPVPCKYLKIKS